MAIIILALTLVTFAQAPQEKFATVFGAKIRYLEAGDATKPNVILLYGLGANVDSWQPTPLVSSIVALSAKYHVIAPDQVGFGKSDKPFLKYRVGTYTDFLDKFMSELKIEKASLVRYPTLSLLARLAPFLSERQFAALRGGIEPESLLQCTVSGTVAAVVFPYHMMLFRILSFGISP